jgi:hypothetical protein
MPVYVDDPVRSGARRRVTTAVCSAPTEPCVVPRRYGPVHANSEADEGLHHPHVRHLND